MKLLITVLAFSVGFLMFSEGTSKVEVTESLEVQAYLIANLVQAECTNCTEEDIDYITFTVMNRKSHKKFPSTVLQVINQPNQFASLNRKIEMGVLCNPYVYKRVLRNLKLKNIPNVLFFISTNCTSKNCQKIINNRREVFRTVNHIYFKEQ